MTLAGASALLLLFLAQAQQDPETAWREWRASLETTLVAPITLDMTIHLALDLDAAHDAEQVAEKPDSFQATVSVSYRALDLRRFRLDVDMRVEFQEDAANPASMYATGGVAADGVTLSAWGRITADGRTEEWRGGARVDQTQVEDLYAQIRARLPDLLETTSQAAGEDEVPAGMADLVLAAYPEQLLAMFHPAQGFTMLDSVARVYDFRRDGDRIHCQLGGRDDSELLMEWRRMMLEMEEDPHHVESVMEFARNSRYQVVMDAATGMPLAAEWQDEFPSAMLEPGLHGMGRGAIRIQTTAFSTTPPSAADLAPPAEGFEWLDLDPYLPLVRGFLNSLAPPPDGSEEDLDF